MAAIFVLSFVLNLSFTFAYRTTSAGCGSDPFVEPGISHRHHIDVDDPTFGVIPRTYRLLLPLNYEPSTPYKLLFDFHGLSMNANQEEDGSNIAMLSGYGVIIVWPNGSNDSESGVRNWNAVGMSNNTGSKGFVCDRHRAKWGEYEQYSSCKQLYGDYDPSSTCYCSSCWNDVLFIETLLNELESTLCLDLSHIHATGISAGGLFSYQIGQSLSHIFASVIPVEGSILIGFNDIEPQHPISLLDFRGTDDTEMPANVSNSYEGLVGPYNSTWSADGFWYDPIDNITRVWASGANQCDGEWMHYPTRFDGIRQFYCVSPHGKCQNGVDVVRCSGKWDHTWPMYNAAPEGYPNVVYEFMTTHPKQEVVWTPRSLI